MNIDTLTEKIYQEGVEKAENEANQIIEDAKKDAETLIKEAEEKSNKIVDKAHQKAKELHQNTLADIKLGGGKAITALKQEIKKLIHEKVIEKPVKELFSDKQFLKELILSTVKNYKTDIDKIILPEALNKKSEERFANSLASEISGVKIDFNKKLSGGFQLSVKDSDYLIAFSDDDFITFFRQFLNEKSDHILFGDP